MIPDVRALASEFTPRIHVGGRFPHFQLRVTAAIHNDPEAVEQFRVPGHRHSLMGFVYRSDVEFVVSSIDLPNAYRGRWVAWFIFPEEFWVRFGLKIKEGRELQDALCLLMQPDGGLLNTALDFDCLVAFVRSGTREQQLQRSPPSSWSTLTVTESVGEPPHGESSRLRWAVAPHSETSKSVGADEYQMHESGTDYRRESVLRMHVPCREMDAQVSREEPQQQAGKDGVVWILEEPAGRMAQLAGIVAWGHCVLVRPDGYVASVHNIASPWASG